MHSYTWHAKNVSKSSPTNVHHVLAYGNLEAIKAVKEELGEERLKNIFVENPQKKKDFVLIE